ncbi:MAG: phospholipase [Hyphomicrobiales bacterium]|nr:dienelactone hydrolase family protein [Hyphomicrobiales bacterium]PCJ88136.1 MAG: phospholipase [Hyphomicrobiales bacterium]
MSSIYDETTVAIGADAETAKIVCVFVHGRTQSPQEMIDQVVRHLDAPTTRFILPKSEGAGWYDARAIDPLTDTSKAEVKLALDTLQHTIECATTECPNATLVLAGFSQGACLSVEYVMRNGAWDGALCLFTGCRVGTTADDLPRADMNGMPVYASCGDADPWIPVPPFQDMVQTLIECGARMRTEAFPGREHCVTATECAALNTMLDNIQNGIHAFGALETSS